MSSGRSGHQSYLDCVAHSGRRARPNHLCSMARLGCVACSGRQARLVPCVHPGLWPRPGRRTRASLRAHRDR